MNPEYIDIQNLYFRYKYNDESTLALEGINLRIKKGEYISIIGKNGAGKSTLARHLNSLLKPDEGSVFIDGLDTRDDSKTWDIRKKVGMIFSNPDNQIIGATLKEEVAFGPENLGIHPERIRKLVNQNLDLVGLLEHINLSAKCLSGGQKQKLVIASVLAMEPECIIFDEATSMIDPFERKEIRKIILKLNKEKGITIINITHSPDETLDSERLIVMDRGRIIFEGKPQNVYMNAEELIKIGIEVPSITRLFYEIGIEGVNVPLNVSDVDQAFRILYEKIQQAGN